MQKVNNLMLLLDHLEELISSSFQFAGKVMVDREELEELIKKIHIALPEDVKQAEWVSREKERYLEQAQEEAKRIIREAEKYAQHLLQDDQIIMRAEDEAKKIIAEAKLSAAEMATEAREYASQVLARLDESLDRTLKIVRQGREELDKNQ
ncbi:MAG: ATPase [Bacillota bacterium]|jgi:vacuolar-type H+-ATPase subunit H